MDKVELKHFFPTYLYTTNIEINSQPLIKALYQEMQTNPGEKVSNVGGYHTKYDIFKYPPFISLTKQLSDIVYNIFQKQLVINSMWGNISSYGCYNSIHNHYEATPEGNYPNGNVSGVLYLKVPPNSGDIIFHEPMNPSTQENITPKENQLLLFSSSTNHSVGPNLSNEDRISLAFNCLFFR